jgi:hypothetical protein
MVQTSRRTAIVDLAISIAFFGVCFALEPVLDPLLRHGRGGIMVFALAAYQFAFEGFAPLLTMRMRHERLSHYGFTRRSIGRSLVLALILAGIYDVAMSLSAGAIFWIPFRHHTAIRMSVALGFPLSLLGIATTVAIWGFFEGLFGIFFASKLNRALGHSGRGWLSPGTLGFAFFNACIHYTHGGISGFLSSFASGYAITVIPAVTENAWGGTLVQTLTNAVGKL